MDRIDPTHDNEAEKQKFLSLLGKKRSTLFIFSVFLLRLALSRDFLLLFCSPKASVFRSPFSRRLMANTHAKLLLSTLFFLVVTQGCLAKLTRVVFGTKQTTQCFYVQHRFIFKAELTFYSFLRN